MVDHKQEAESVIGSDWGSSHTTNALLEGQIHATLYLAEQQRIANIIALSQVRIATSDFPPFRGLVMEPGEYSVVVKAEIREALDLG